jgi:ATP-dependent HslUV protease ATP-binding subunit HslU
MMSTKNNLPSVVVMSEMIPPMTPREITAELDNWIVGQDDAKRAVAIALRNRWRRAQVEDDVLRREITPKNILMMGPTGVGKSEIARRLANLAGAPFVKVEATKFTEVGYVGRDCESMIRDLVEAAMKMTREKEMEKVHIRAEESAEERLLNALLPPAKPEDAQGDEPKKKTDDASARQVLRKQLREGKLDDKEVDIDMALASVGVEIMGHPGMEDVTSQLQELFQNMSADKTKRRRMKVGEAFKLLAEEEAAKMVNEDQVRQIALENVSQNGIVFIDELDKIVRAPGVQTSGEVSREGVQRDLLPLIEGSPVNTKYGTVHTDHILFIASGAFQLSKPSDLVPELQGRLPIRVELQALTAKDFIRILKEPEASLTEQYTALMATEGVTLSFSDEGVEEIAEIACKINDSDENIGARRLHTALEFLLRDLSFEATDCGGKKVVVDKKYVDEKFKEVDGAKWEDLSRYIL